MMSNQFLQENQKPREQIRTLSLMQDYLDRLPDTRIQLSALRQSEEGPGTACVADQEEVLPGWLRIVRKIAAVVLILSMISSILCAAAGLASGGYTTPALTYPSLALLGISFAVILFTVALKAWMRRQAWIRRMRQQDAEKVFPLTQTAGIR